MGEFRTTLTPLRGTLVMLNIVLGAGLLTLPGLAVAQAGANALTVWLACALASLPLLAAFALIGRRYPDRGGLAMVSGKAFGRYGYALTTFLFLGAVLFGLPSIALTGGYYVMAMLGGSAHVYAVGFLILAVSINLLSVEHTSGINALIAGVALVALIGLALVGLVIAPPQWDALLPPIPPTIPVQTFGLTFMMIFFAFTGWELAANLSAEFHNPHRDVPIAMGLSFLIAVGLYVLLAVLAGGMGPTERPEAPFVALFERKFGLAGAVFVVFAAVILVIANLAAAVWAVSRMVWAAAGQGLLPRKLCLTRDGTPYLAVLATVGALISVVGISALGMLDLGGMLAIAGQNFLIIYTVAALALAVCSPGMAEKWLAALCLTEVMVLLSLRGGEGLLYPAGIFALALVVSVRARATLSSGPD